MFVWLGPYRNRLEIVNNNRFRAVATMDTICLLDIYI